MISLLAVAMLAPDTTAMSAGPAARDPFADATPLSHQELSEARGGVNIAGFQFEFGLSVATLIDQAKSATDLPNQVLVSASGPVAFQNGISSTGFAPVVIDNVLDDVVVMTMTRLDIVIPNFDHRMSQFTAGAPIFDFAQVHGLLAPRF